jgi:hypothetical protein
MPHLTKTYAKMGLTIHRHFARLAVVLIASVLTACANKQPTVVEMSAQADRKLVVVVEEPHRFHTPFHMQSGEMGIPLLDISSGLTALSIEKRCEELHTRLNDRAQAMPVWQNKPTPQAEFVQSLPTCLQAMDMMVELRSVPFQLRGIGTAGREFMFVPSDTRMTSSDLAYSLRLRLRLDMGNRSLQQTIPCIRYEWMRLGKSSRTATVGSFYQHRGTYPVIPRQPEQQAALPGDRAALPQSDADIREFDAAVGHQSRRQCSSS